MTFLLFYSLLVVYSMDIIRSFSVFCSYKLEFYHERLSVSQKARIKYIFRSIDRKELRTQYEIFMVFIYLLQDLESRNESQFPHSRNFHFFFFSGGGEDFCMFL
jgi:hypothetical protein